MESLQKKIEELVDSKGLDLSKVDIELLVWEVKKELAS